jgi:hypothetical protein
VLFPLRLTPQQTTAASPMPGQMVAAGESGKLLMAVFLVVLITAVCTYLWRRPARDLGTALLQMTVIWTMIFSLAPSTRYGYFIYPLLTLGLHRLVASRGAGPRFVRSPRPPAPSSVEIR